MHWIRCIWLIPHLSSINRSQEYWEAIIRIYIWDYYHFSLNSRSCQCTNYRIGLWDDNPRWLTTKFIYSHWNCWNCIFVTMRRDWHEFHVDAWMNRIYSSDMMNEQMQIWNIRVNNMFPMQCIAYMTPVYCWKHIIVTMRGHWQDFCWDAWMNWVYSSDTINESNANLEFMGQLHVSDAVHCIYVTGKVLKSYICHDARALTGGPFRHGWIEHIARIRWTNQMQI
jgi:hypothetical protein